MHVTLAVAFAVSDAPQAADIERLLQRREFCLVSIDACLDGEGNQIIPNSTYKVGSVWCDTAPKLQAIAPDRIVLKSVRCRFSVRETSWIGGQRVGPDRVHSQKAIFDLIRTTARLNAEEVPRQNETWRWRATDGS
jgi:hypothetical protein